MTLTKTLSKEWLSLLLLFLPIAFILELTHQPAPWVFACSCLAIIPLAGWMGRATEHLSERLGAGVGGLLNASFGNAAELIIAVMALRRGLVDVVKASITGSIVGNLLLVAGLSILLGGTKHARQNFNKTAAGLTSTLLAIGAAALLVPAMFHSIAESAISRGALTAVKERALENGLSLEISIVLFVVYVLSLVFSLKTHKDLFAGEDHQESHSTTPAWSTQKAVCVLLAATVGVGFAAEWLVGAVEATAHSWGLSDIFVGVIVVAIVGNAAEHSSAVLLARKNKMDVALHIANGSSLQVALFVAPMLVFFSYTFGSPMDLLFTPFEVLSIALSVGVINLVCQDGESHWMEGVLLLALYLILAFAFYCLPV